MGKVLRQVMRDVLVHHPRRPYKIRAYQHDAIPDLILVRLTQNFCRVIHTPTGLALTDTDNAKVAEKFLLAMEELFQKDAHLVECFNNLTWDGFFRHKKEESFDPEIQYMLDKTRDYTCAVGHVGSKLTAKCRYKYSPEYLT